MPRRDTKAEKRVPVHAIGPFSTGSALVEVAIWNNAAEEAEPSFAVSVKRTYRDGDAWKESKAFRPQDLPHLMIALQQAYLWIQDQNGKK